MKLALALAIGAVLVAGCGDYVNEEQWGIMSAACKSHGGVKWTLSAGYFGNYYEVECRSGEVIKIPREAKKK